MVVSKRECLKCDAVASRISLESDDTWLQISL